MGTRASQIIKQIKQNRTSEARLERINKELSHRKKEEEKQMQIYHAQQKLNEQRERDKLNRPTTIQKATSIIGGLFKKEKKIARYD
jgi:hypothetical protein